MCEAAYQKTLVEKNDFTSAIATNKENIDMKDDVKKEVREEDRRVEANLKKQSCMTKRMLSKRKPSKKLRVQGKLTEVSAMTKNAKRTRNPMKIGVLKW